MYLKSPKGSKRFQAVSLETWWLHLEWLLSRFPPEKKSQKSELEYEMGLQSFAYLLIYLAR